MTAPTITILIPTYNRSDMLCDTLACMIAQETENRFSYEIMVIDDASTDDTAAVMKKLIAESPVPMRYIYGAGRGYTGVLNRALEEFKGEWLAFFDDDQLCQPAWLKSLYFAACEQEVDMVGGPIVLDLSKEILAGLGTVCRDLYGESPDVRNPEDFVDTPPLPSGGNRLVRRRVFELVGAFDESMLTGGCDRDFLLRARDAGVRMGWAPRAVGRHRILPERITYRHIKWYSLQWGCSFAYIDHKRSGLLTTLFAAIARMGQSLFCHGPILLWLLIFRDKSAILDRQALLWRSVGYGRRTLQILAPRLFVQEAFFSRVEFRRSQEHTGE